MSVTLSVPVEGLGARASHKRGTVGYDSRRRYAGVLRASHSNGRWMRLSRLRSRITLEIVGPTAQYTLGVHRNSYNTTRSIVLS